MHTIMFHIDRANAEKEGDEGATKRSLSIYWAELQPFFPNVSRDALASLRDFCAEALIYCRFFSPLSSAILQLEL